jgi:hypothetical protein
MATHKYQIGEEVRFRPAMLQVGSRTELYVIVRLLPEEGDSLQYRIKHKANGLERVASERQLSLVAAQRL